MHERVTRVKVTITCGLRYVSYDLVAEDEEMLFDLVDTFYHCPRVVSAEALERMRVNERRGAGA